MFAVYAVLTRMAGKVDSPMTSFFYTGIAGCAVISLIGPFYWTNMAPADWAWMGLLCLTSTPCLTFHLTQHHLPNALGLRSDWRQIFFRDTKHRTHQSYLGVTRQSFSLKPKRLGFGVNPSGHASDRCLVSHHSLS